MAAPSTHDHHDDAWSQMPIDVQTQLLADDSEAWHAVAFILLGVVSIGVALAFLTVYLNS